MGKKSPKRSPKKAKSPKTTSRSKKPARKKAPAKTPKSKEALNGQAAAARHWGVSIKTIQTWKQNGLPVSGSSRKQTFVLADCEPWVAAFRNETQDSESKKLNEELKKEKLLQEKLKRKDLERKDQIADDKLLSREEYELFAAECVIEARDQMLTLPKEMRRHLCKKCQAKVEEMQMLIEQTLQRLSAIEDGPKQ